MMQKIIKIIKMLIILVLIGILVFFTNVHFGRESYINYIEDVLLFLIIISMFIRKINTFYYLISSLILLGSSAILEIFSQQVFSEVFSEIAYFVLLVTAIKRLMELREKSKT
jgi:hypothetical protein